jgi:hypothetical protein
MTTQPPGPPPAARPLPGLVPAHLRQEAAGLVPKPADALPSPVEALQKTRRTARIPTTGDRDALLAAVRSSASRARPELAPALAKLEQNRSDPFALQALCAALASDPELWQPVRRQLEPFVQLPAEVAP